MSALFGVISRQLHRGQGSIGVVGVHGDLMKLGLNAGGHALRWNQVGVCSVKAVAPRLFDSASSDAELERLLAHRGVRRSSEREGVDRIYDMRMPAHSSSSLHNQRRFQRHPLVLLGVFFAQHDGSRTT